MNIEAWWDIGRINTERHLDAHLRAIEDLGLSGLAIMVNRQKDTTWGLSLYPYDACVRFARRLRDMGVRVTITSWIRPDRSFMDGILEELVSLGQDCHADIEFDAEGANWGRVKPIGLRSHEEAGVYLADGLGLFVDMGGRWTTTTVTTQPYWDISRHADGVCPQAYSIWDRHHCSDKYRVGGIYGPGQRQLLAWDRHHRPELDQEIVMGLPAWAQRGYPGSSSPEAIMEICWNGAKAAGAKRVRYWSWKWIAGKKGTTRGYAYRFIKGKAKEV